MLCDINTFWLVLLGFMATMAWGADDIVIGSQRSDGEKTSKQRSLARKAYKSSNFWGRLAVPGGAGRNKPGRYYDEDEDEDEDDGYYGYGESSYGDSSYGDSSYGDSSYGSYDSYGSSYGPQIIQIPPIQQYQPSYYYQPQQQPIIIGGGGGGGKHHKKKIPICCCYTEQCLEPCHPSSNSACGCDMRCCRKYNTTTINEVCLENTRSADSFVLLKKFDYLDNEPPYAEDEEEES